MKQNYAPVIKTERLCLQALRDEDAEDMLALLTNEDVGKTYMVPTFESREDAVRTFERLQTLSLSEERFVYGIYLEDRLIGMINEVDVNDTEIELGYVIHPTWHNQGYATEVLNKAMQTLFAQGYSVVKAGAFEENAASIRVMEKSGMTRTAQEEYVEYRGKRHRCVCYQRENRTEGEI